MLEEALRCPDLLLRVFVDESLEGEYQAMSEIYPQVEWYVCDSKLINILSDTESPQGVVSVARIPQWSWKEISSAEPFLLLLDQISDPGNLGTIIRTGWALGADGVLLTEDCVDPYNPKVVRSSMGGIFHLPVFPNIGTGELQLLKNQGYKFLCSSLQASQSCYKLDFTKKSVVVIGSESRGVSQEIITWCDTLFKIPINSQVDSLNAAVACAIIIYEAYKQRIAPSL